ncbi:Protein of unknown function [Pyronema omphalodes CBS 100304]|uniref:Uncharacterized protein n=1 Tax=Pyronema omphalodes (strain CBS 100304) TaxID=1076935 RepID=U4L943_PYROM|nr:Protein of unknown function [Pyronema omphalodes CBS 100304]
MYKRTRRSQCSYSRILHPISPSDQHGTVPASVRTPLRHARCTLQLTPCKKFLSSGETGGRIMSTT